MQKLLLGFTLAIAAFTAAAIVTSYDRSPLYVTLSSAAQENVVGGGICCVNESHECEPGNTPCAETECVKQPDGSHKCEKISEKNEVANAWLTCKCDAATGLLECTDATFVCTEETACASGCLQSNLDGKYYCQTTGPTTPDDTHDGSYASGGACHWAALLTDCFIG